MNRNSTPCAPAASRLSRTLSFLSAYAEASADTVAPLRGARRARLYSFQSNLRLSMNAQNIAVALTTVANILIQLNQEFITDDKLYRLVGKKVDFKEFKKEDKKVVVDAIVEVEPVIPPDKTTRLNQVLLMYDKFIAQDKPDPNNPEEETRWLKRKRELQKMILEELDKEEYIDVLLGPEAEARALPQTNNAQAPVTPTESQPQPTEPVYTRSKQNSAAYG